MSVGGEPANGWDVARSGIGDHGTDHETRAVVARSGLGADLPEDAVCRIAGVGSRSGNLSSGRAYVLHFPVDRVPQVNAFGSLTMYDDQGYFVGSPIGRYAVRGESLVKNSDGSLDIRLRSENPEPGKEHEDELTAPRGRGSVSPVKAGAPTGPQITPGQWGATPPHPHPSPSPSGKAEAGAARAAGPAGSDRTTYGRRDESSARPTCSGTRSRRCTVARRLGDRLPDSHM